MRLLRRQVVVVEESLRGCYLTRVNRATNVRARGIQRTADAPGRLAQYTPHIPGVALDGVPSVRAVVRKRLPGTRAITLGLAQLIRVTGLVRFRHSKIKALLQARFLQA